MFEWLLKEKNLTFNKKGITSLWKFILKQRKYLMLKTFVHNSPCEHRVCVCVYVYTYISFFTSLSNDLKPNIIGNLEKNKRKWLSKNK